MSRAKAEEAYSKMNKLISTISIMGEITPKVASDFRRQLLVLERLKRSDTITVEINSIGGDMEAGLMIIDSIQICAKPVITRVTGVAYSMASLILASGNIREALPNSTIMVHQGSYKLSARYEELDIEAGECKRIERVCNDFLDKQTGKMSGYWEKRHNGKNLYLTAEQALDEKIVHSILRKV